MNEPKRVSVWILLPIAILISAVAFNEAYGDDGHGHHHDDGGDVTIDNVLTGGDVSTGDLGVSTRGLSVGGSDMEIADGLATHSILFGLWQGTHTNPYAEADKLEARGKYEAAAKMRCSTRKYSKVYGKGQICVDAVIFIKPTEITRQTPADDIRIEALYARLSEIEAIRIQDKAEAEKAVETANIAAQRANAMARRVQTQQQAPDDGSTRRAMAREAYQKAKEE
jgi:hypothetical protein